MNAIMQSPYFKAAVVLGGLFAVQHFVKDGRVKAACYGAGATILLKQIPWAGDVA